jgi:hypothetical protein
MKLKSQSAQCLRMRLKKKIQLKKQEKTQVNLANLQNLRLGS